MNKYQETALRIFNWYVPARYVHLSKALWDDNDGVSSILARHLLCGLVDWEDMRRAFRGISDVSRLIEFAIAFPRHYPKEPAIVPTIRQWSASAKLSGVSLEERLVLEGELRRSVICQTSSVTADSIDIYNYDWNAVRTLSGAGTKHRKTRQGEDQEVTVVIWLSGHVDAADESTLHEALEELLLREDVIPLEYTEPMRGSFFQVIRFIGRFTKYGAAVASHLRTAFHSAATGYDIEATDKLSRILKKHDNAVVRVGAVIAVKVTRQGKTYAVIVNETPATVIKALSDDPQLVTHPDLLYDLLVSSVRQTVTPLSAAKGPKPNRAVHAPETAVPRDSEDEDRT